MGKTNVHILTTGKGKNKREFELSEDEFREFLMRYEENELIDMSQFVNPQLTLTTPPERKGRV